MEKKNTTVNRKGSVAGTNFDLHHKTPCRCRYRLQLWHVVVAVPSITCKETLSLSAS